MSVTNAAGAVLSETALNALTAAPTGGVTLRRITQDIYQRYTYEGHKGPNSFERGQRLLFRAGQVVPQSAIDALFADATVTGVSPATGPAAGGTDVVITGTNLGGVLGVTIGGAAATLVRTLDETRVSCRTPAGTAGARDVVVTDDSGPVTRTGGYTYV